MPNVADRSRAPHAGLFVSFEGGEGSGKSTQIQRLADRLRKLDLEVVVTREPGGSPQAEVLREMVLGREWDQRAELMLFLAARAQHCRDLVGPALVRGAAVLSDRFHDSTLAYQGAGLGLPVDWLRELTLFAAGSLQTDLTLLLDIPPEQGLRRRCGADGKQMALELTIYHPDGSEREGVNRMENRQLEFHRRVRQGFLDEAERDPQRVKIINARRSEDEVEEAVWKPVHRILVARAAIAAPKESAR